MGSQGLSSPATTGEAGQAGAPDQDAPAEARHPATDATGAPPVADVPSRPGPAPRLRVLPALYPIALGAADGLSMAAAVTWAAAAEPPAAVAAAVAVTCVNAMGGRYRRRRRPSLLDDAPALAVRAAIVAAVVTVLLPAAWGPEALDASHRSLAALAAVADGWFRILLLHCLLAGTGRVAVHAAVRIHRRRRPVARAAILIGAGPTAEHVTGVLRRRRDLGLEPVGQILTGDLADEPIPGLPVLGRPLDLRYEVDSREASTIVIVTEDVGRPYLDALVRTCSVLPCETLLVLSTMDLLAGAGARTPIEHLAGLPCLRLGPRSGERLARAAKRAFDVAAAGSALLLIWPVLLACALAVRLEGGPGVLFRQCRVGAGGREFVLLKFRSLRPADDREADTRWSVDGDARMGPVGRFMRETSLDELPQLWNVIRGDMSLVGPRPERPHFVRLFSETCPGYALRHRVPVGLTGWAQVNGLRGDTSIELRAKLDNRYIDTWSFGTDLKILLMTVRTVLARTDP